VSKKGGEGYADETESSLAAGFDVRTDAPSQPEISLICSLVRGF